MIYSHEFPNGLVLVAEPNLALESAAFSFLTPSGSSEEPASRLGLSPLTIDMLLRGAGDRDSREFLFDLEILGVERSESVHIAHTSISGATIGANLLPALEIYADLLRRPHIPEDELEAGKNVLLQELQAIEDDPSHKAMIALRAAHYADPWGRSSYGEADHIEASTLEEVQKFWQSTYRPNGTILGVAGKFDWNELKDEVERLFGDWASSASAPQPVSSKRVRWQHIPHESNQMQICLAFDSVPFRDPMFYQASGAVGVLSGGMSSRLFTEVREKRGLCYTVYASHHTLRDQAAVFCYAGTSAERAQETLDVLVAELLRWNKGIEAQELDRLKARIKSSLIMQQESSSARSGSIARDWYHLGRARTLVEVGGLVDKLTRDSINQFLVAHPARDFTVLTLGPKPLEAPHGIS